MAATHENDQLWVTNPTREPFTVKWGGNPVTLQPGQKLVMLRFIANHFAKHLADKILLQKEQAHKKSYQATGASMSDYNPKNYLNSKRERPDVVKSIILGVYSYFQTPAAANDPNAAAQAAIQQMMQNQPQQVQQPQVTDMGPVITDTAIGALTDDDDEEEQGQQFAQQPQPPQAPMGPPPQQPQMPSMQPQPQAPMVPPPVTPTPPPRQQPDPDLPLPGQTSIPAAPPQAPPQMPSMQPQPQQPQAPQQPSQPPQQPPGGDSKVAELSRSDLFKEAKKLGLKVPGSMSNEDLRHAIIHF